MEIGPDGAFRYTQEFLDATAAKQQAADDAAAAYQAQHADDVQQDAVDAAAATKQTVPDEHPGATHVHDEPRAPEHHEIVHYAADPTAPAHIPVNYITGK